MHEHLCVVALGLALVSAAVTTSAAHSQSLTGAQLPPPQAPLPTRQGDGPSSGLKRAAIGPVRYGTTIESLNERTYSNLSVGGTNWNLDASSWEAGRTDSTREAAIKWAWRGLAIAAVGLTVMLLTADSDSVVPAVGAGVLVVGIGIGSIAATVAATRPR